MTVIEYQLVLRRKHARKGIAAKPLDLLTHGSVSSYKLTRCVFCGALLCTGNDPLVFRSNRCDVPQCIQNWHSINKTFEQKWHFGRTCQRAASFFATLILSN